MARLKIGKKKPLMTLIHPSSLRETRFTFETRDMLGPLAQKSAGDLLRLSNPNSQTSSSWLLIELIPIGIVFLLNHLGHHIETCVKLGRALVRTEKTWPLGNPLAQHPYLLLHYYMSLLNGRTSSSSIQLFVPPCRFTS